MGNGCRKDNENVYFQARKNAALSNDRLSSREKAAELLGVSESTLADYELGTTKIVPPDRVVRMADLYRSPELKNWYCKNECPIGADRPLATEVKGIEGVVLKIVKEFKADRIYAFRDKLVEIAHDGEISEEEIPMLQFILGWSSDMELALSQLRVVAEKIIEKGDMG